MNMTKYQALKLYFGYTSFRGAQEALIDGILSGRDVLGVMPTGSGKSICYQIPAVLSDGLTLVVSPLISLMKDQVSQLKQAGIGGAYVNSSLTPEQCAEVFRRALDGRYKIMYVAPERLETAAFLRFICDVSISLIAVDEAHCVSQWGQDFRPSYLKIPNFVRTVKNRPPVAAFTATATSRVMRDMVRMLELRSPLSLTTGFDRPNLFFKVVKPVNKLAFFRELIPTLKDDCGIVYCATRGTVDALHGELNRRGVPAVRYHAGMDLNERKQNQDSFLGSGARMMVATNAFGMGINKPDVRKVIHYEMPKNIESYYQEAGRAGRDGKPADCILIFSESDIAIAEYFINNSAKNSKLTDKEIKIKQSQDMGRLDAMIGFCETKDCLRGYLLKYFGEKHGRKCGNCANCAASKTALQTGVRR